jgi:hypothetical protein
MNIYKLLKNKLNNFLLSKLTDLIYPPKLDIKRSINININNNDLNLIIFTLKTIDFNEFKTLLLNFNVSNIVSASHFLTTPPCHIFLFDSDGKLFRHYKFHIHKPENEKTELAFDNFVIDVKNHIFESCVYETTKKKCFCYKF